MILKAEPNKDLYVLWSTISEMPYYAGTRAECKVKLGWSGEEADDERFDRADQLGSSNVDGLDGWDKDKTTGSVIVAQKGLVSHKDLPEVYRLARERLSYDHLVRAFEED